MIDFAPAGFLTLRQCLNKLTSELSSADIGIANEMAREYRENLQQNLYQSVEAAFFIDPAKIDQGIKPILPAFWGTEGGTRALQTGRYYPLGYSAKGNPYIPYSDGTTFFIKTQKTSNGVGRPSERKERVRRYLEIWPSGHKAEKVTTKAARVKFGTLIGEPDLARGTFNDIINDAKKILST